MKTVYYENRSEVVAILDQIIEKPEPTKLISRKHPERTMTVYGTGDLTGLKDEIKQTPQGCWR